MIPDEDVDCPGGIDFVTLGMFIIGKYTLQNHSSIVADVCRSLKPKDNSDDIEYGPSVPRVRDAMGGAGAYSALGARIFSPSPLSSSVAWIVDQGSDFPTGLDVAIDAWSTTALKRRDESRLTTRGWNGYEGPAEKRAFKYLTPKKRITTDDLTPEMLLSRSFHLICSPLRCQDLIHTITSRRRALTDPGQVYTKPLFIWEPVPDLCVPDELLNCTNTLPLVDICSPNHSELAGFMGEDGVDPETGGVCRRSVERACEQLLASMPLQSYALVVRAGAEGCFIAKNGGRKGRRGTRVRKTLPRGSLQPDTDMEALFAGLVQDEEGLVARDDIEIDPGTECWIPAYHQDQKNVVDPTGGGNAFLGAMSVALARGRPLEAAAACGSVAASFAIEQVGMPLLTMSNDGDEMWNGVRVRERLEAVEEKRTIDGRILGYDDHLTAL
ncbi:hypothetical protein HIM_02763 [Hirsutella minnesotensis 3608]|nr:hypothetical protein HIM_02763 [Hirsutella minnesotensis 3608]